MQIYLPIAGVPIDAFLIIFLSGVTGVLSGMFGIGGGFLMTPILIFLGIPPMVAVASSTNQIIASSLSGCLAHLNRHNVDIKMGLVLTAGGTIGSSIGIWTFNMLNKIGQIDLVIHLCYVFLLGSISSVMLVESIMKIIKQKKIDKISLPEERKENRLEIQGIANKLSFIPFRTYFPVSNIEVSFLLPFFIGLFAGILVSIMGIGGGFIMMPAMIYILGMKTITAIGTSLFQIVFVTSFSTFMHAVTNQSVDIILTILMLTGATIGAQIGSLLAIKTTAAKLRAMMSVIVLCVVVRLIHNLVTEPSNPFMIIPN